ncbi:MAG: hypothetical protein U9P90_02970 [Patescibacteria group bacterium]|nr:hypothetical protein [Patescibacteria group bacterium]
MEISFRDNKIKKQVAKKVRSNNIANRRLTQLKNAICFTDIPASAKAHFLQGNLKNCFAVDFDYPARLICEPAEEFRKDGNGQFIKESITALEILEIKKDYH